MSVSTLFVTFGLRPQVPNSVDTSKSVFNLYIDLGFTAVDVAAILGVSRSTICRRLRECGLSMQRKYCAISDQDLDDIVLTIAQQYPDCGQKMMQGHLRERGIMVQQTRIRESMRRIDPYGTDVRFRTSLRRRQYNVGYPMELWHLDGNHKLIRHTCTHTIC